MPARGTRTAERVYVGQRRLQRRCHTWPAEKVRKAKTCKRDDGNQCLVRKDALRGQVHVCRCSRSGGGAVWGQQQLEPGMGDGHRGAHHDGSAGAAAARFGWIEK